MTLKLTKKESEIDNVYMNKISSRNPKVDSTCKIMNCEIYKVLGNTQTVLIDLYYL